MPVPVYEIIRITMEFRHGASGVGYARLEGPVIESAAEVYQERGTVS